MPVGTQATVKSLSPTDLRAAGAEIILGNTYHLWLRPGHEPIARLGGLHRFMGWDGPILTDSGGYQVVSLAHLRTVDDAGVRFASHLDGAALRLTPELAMEIQASLGSDVAMVLDHPVDPLSPGPVVEDALRRSQRWAERCRAVRARPGQAVFGIVQGGIDPRLRREAARHIASLDFDGIAVGGLAGSETKAQMAATLDVVGDELADDPRPRYLMGMGYPTDFFAAVERGIDLFDSVLPTRVARNGQAWTSEGRLNLRNARYTADAAPLDPACRCETCRGFSRAYLAHLFRARELLAYRLTSLHNLTYTLDLMERLRTALADGSFSALRQSVARRFPVADEPDDDAVTAR
ncbi:MAG: tRNA guanosine(34) transglycosylase Tgt [Chloroflexota bacterium]|nr:tRNA guanosine(34) transglycosylase Tgt [Chloroflexota bacterium]